MVRRPGQPHLDRVLRNAGLSNRELAELSDAVKLYVQYRGDNMFHVEHFTDLQECSTREPFTVWVVGPDGSNIVNRKSSIFNSLA
ncbi:MAG: hypothetical protein DMG72_02740, partial [Acidobacteria bacterium]